MDDLDAIARHDAAVWWGAIVGGVLAVDLTMPRRQRERLAARRLTSAAVDALEWPDADFDDRSIWALALAVIDATAFCQGNDGAIEHHRRTGDLEGARDLIWERMEPEWGTDEFAAKGPELVELLLVMIAGHGDPHSDYPDVAYWTGVGDLHLGNLERATLERPPPAPW